MTTINKLLLASRACMVLGYALGAAAGLAEVRQDPWLAANPNALLALLLGRRAP